MQPATTTYDRGGQPEHQPPHAGDPIGFRAFGIDDGTPPATARRGEPDRDREHAQPAPARAAHGRFQKLGPIGSWKSLCATT